MKQEKIEPEKTYGFQLKISIAGKEYEANRRNINDYVMDKMKQTREYRQCIMECIRKENADREYTVETFVANECDNPHIDYSIHRTEEYITQY